MDPTIDGSGGNSIVPFILLGIIVTIVAIVLVVGLVNIIRHRGKKAPDQTVEHPQLDPQTARDLRNAQANNALGRGIGRSL